LRGGDDSLPPGDSTQYFDVLAATAPEAMKGATQLRYDAEEGAEPGLKSSGVLLALVGEGGCSRSVRA